MAAAKERRELVRETTALTCGSIECTRERSAPFDTIEQAGGQLVIDDHHSIVAAIGSGEGLCSQQGQLETMMESSASGRQKTSFE
jgi:hypothetical protein